MLLRFGAEVGHLHQISPRAKAIVSSYGLDRSGLEDRYHRLASHKSVIFLSQPDNKLHQISADMSFLRDFDRCETLKGLASPVL